VISKGAGRESGVRGEGMASVPVDRRLRRIGLSAFSSLGARAVTVAISFVTVPLCLSYLGTDLYGLWATITSFVAMLVFVDMGIGNGVMNGVASAYGREDYAAIRRIVANGLLVLSLVALAGLALFGAWFPFVSWIDVLGLKDSALESVAARSMAVLAVLFALNIPAGVVQRVQFALQQGYLSGIFQVVGSVLSLGLIVLAVAGDWGLTGLVAAFLAAPLIAAWIGGLLMLRKQAYLRPRIPDIDRKAMKDLAATGMQFFALQVAAAVCYGTDNIVIAHLAGHDAVAAYSVHLKLFSPIQILAGVALTPLWPAYSEALARGDLAWVRRILARSLFFLAFGGAVCAAAVLALADPLMRIWLGGRIAADFGLSAALCVWVIVELTGRGIAMFLNGANILKAQLAIVAVFVPLCIALKVLLVRDYGAAGAPMALALSYAATHIPGYGLILRRWFAGNRTDARRLEAAE